ncbi:MAG: septal ring lytic transglycosylase RlpA family protein [Hyphomonas sp.]|nr:septal ring lytic transglycosylase RlpA family protein [Hyphomonas sp.]
MRVPSTRVIDRLPALLVSALAAALVSTPAQADSRTGAPIVYKTQDARISPERQTVFITPGQAQPSADKARARVEFQYPGASTAAPAAPQTRQPAERFATPTPAAREYASISAPISSAPPAIAGQVATPKPFDPQAAAQRVANERAQSQVEAESLPTLAGAPELEAEQGGFPAPAPEVAPPASSLTPAAAHLVTPEAVPVFDETGAAIVYGDEFEGLPTANGEIFSQTEFMAAHPNLPLPSLVQVVNLDTNTEVVVRVNDRGPFEDGAMLQVSQRAAAELGMTGAGRANVRVRYLGPAPVIAAPKTAPLQVAEHKPTAAPSQTASISTVSAPNPAYGSQRAGTPSYQPVSVGHYFVQVGAFSQISNAQNLIQSMPNNLSAQIDPAQVNGTDFFRVRVGPFMSRDAADRMKDDLRRHGINNGRVVSQN